MIKIFKILVISLLFVSCEKETITAIEHHDHEINYKVYSCLMSQKDEGDPTVNVLGFNDLGAIVWVREHPGVYSGTLTGAFVSNKTWIVIGDDSVDALDKWIIIMNANEVSLRTANAGVFTDGLLSDFSIEIKVYD